MKKQRWFSIVRILLGTTLLAAAINVFFEEQGLVTGGVTGAAIMIKEVTKPLIQGGVPLWMTNLLLNIPLFLGGLFTQGKQFLGKTLFATVFLSAALYFTKFLPILTDDLLLNSIFGGVVAGVGIGFVFLSFATTGGTDLAGSILHHYIDHITTATFMFCIDAMIICFGIFVFGMEKAMYAILSVFITSRVIDTFLEGVHFSKGALIISDQYEKIGKVILQNLDRGATEIFGKGIYTQSNRQLILSVVSKKEIVRLKKIVHEIDPDAFIIITDVREVFGQGFTTT